MSRPVALVVMGTRPEAIKLAPVIEALHNHGTLAPFVVATSQHRQLLPQALAPFDLNPDLDLEVMTADQSAAGIATRVISGLEPVFERVRPVWTVVQGDTTSAFAAAVASFYAGVPVAHVEAGLRTGRLDAPFPEEFNRRGIAVASGLHLAPTRRAAANLVGEGIEPARVVVVGNPVVDAVMRIRSGRTSPVPADGRHVVLMTLHRRESFGKPIERVLRAVKRLANDYCGRVRIVYPVHPNPNVDHVARRVLAGVDGVELVPPMIYPEFLDTFAGARFAMTDSGGVQEEAPTLGVPVLVLREVTERPELVDSGWGMLVGTDEERIVAAARRLIDSDQALAAMKQGPNPFGDGHAGDRIAKELAKRMG